MEWKGRGGKGEKGGRGRGGEGGRLSIGKNYLLKPEGKLHRSSCPCGCVLALCA